MRKITSLIVTALFLVNNITYALSPQPGSLNPGTRNEMCKAAALRIAHNIGPGTGRLLETLEKLTEEERHVFKGRPLNLKWATNFRGADWDNPPRYWRNNKALSGGIKYHNLLAALGIYINRKIKSSIPENIILTKGYLGSENVIIECGYFRANEEEGELPVAQIEKEGDKIKLILHPKIGDLWDSIKINDIWFDYTFPDGRTRTVSCALELLKWLAEPNKRTKKCDIVAEAVKLWFLGSFCMPDSVRYNNETFGRRLNWIFKEGSISKRHEELHSQFPNINTPDRIKERKLAMQLARLINYHYFVRIGQRRPPSYKNIRVEEESIVDERTGNTSHIPSYRFVYYGIEVRFSINPVLLPYLQLAPDDVKNAVCEHIIECGGNMENILKCVYSDGIKFGEERLNGAYRGRIDIKGVARRLDLEGIYGRSRMETGIVKDGLNKKLEGIEFEVRQGGAFGADELFSNIVLITGTIRPAEEAFQKDTEETAEERKESQDTKVPYMKPTEATPFGTLFKTLGIKSKDITKNQESKKPWHHAQREGEQGYSSVPDTPHIEEGVPFPEGEEPEEEMSVHNALLRVRYWTLCTPAWFPFLPEDIT
ncbi:MAG: hypothetical protein JW994_08090, partial [Candidatus Omnitrophica bacterium]|nr:hypothetical protein [Candidatus Omnitrophota bacterium]